MTTKPERRPLRPHFSSGPCAKRPGWSVAGLRGACLGRSHRSPAGLAKLREAIERTRALLALPAEYRLGIVPASDTGAVEMALWCLLGERGVDVLAWDSFGREWIHDAVRELRITDVRVLDADFGQLPDLSRVDGSRDVVFTWNGTSAGVCVPDGDWIDPERTGLTICDATSAVFAIELPWDKLDVTTFSWQKVMGGEAAHGMIILSPRALDRLRTYSPSWPVPKILRLAHCGRVAEEVFAGATINTPSLLCVEDYLDTLTWAESVGGLSGLTERCRRNYAVMADWMERTPWVDNLACEPAHRSPTSVCMRIVDAWFVQLARERQAAAIKELCALLEREGVAYDVNGYRDAPPGLRVWCGGTVDTTDLEALTPWLDWAYAQVTAKSEGAV
jgi:phosphoserine aminotransferase